MAEPPTPGWYVIRRADDDAVSCLYTAGNGWWAMCGSNRRGLPSGWALGPAIDALLDLDEGFKIGRREADPRTIDRD